MVVVVVMMIVPRSGGGGGDDDDGSGFIVKFIYDLGLLSKRSEKRI